MTTYRSIVLTVFRRIVVSPVGDDRCGCGAARPGAT
jgi:hypothetical protein